MRFLTPAIFLAAAGWVAWYNANHVDQYHLRWLIDLIAPATRGDVVAQGRWTVGVLGALGALFLVRDIFWVMRARAARRTGIEE